MTEEDSLQPSWTPGERDDLVGRALVPFSFGEDATGKDRGGGDGYGNNSVAKGGGGMKGGTKVSHHYIDHTHPPPNMETMHSHQYHHEEGEGGGEAEERRRSISQGSKGSTNRDRDKFAAPTYLSAAPDPKDIPLPSWLWKGDSTRKSGAGGVVPGVSRKERDSSRTQKGKNGKESPTAASKPKDAAAVVHKTMVSAPAKVTPRIKKKPKSRFVEDKALAEQMSREDLKALCKKLPKAELQARVIGSVRPQTLQEFLQPLSKDGVVSQEDLAAFALKSQKDVATATRLLHIATESLSATTRVIEECMTDYAEENVRYLELRLSLRPVPSYRKFFIGVLKALSKPPTVMTSSGPRPLVPRLVITLRREHGAEAAESIVAIVSEFFQTNICNAASLVAGVELGGSPKEGSFEAFSEVLQQARDSGLAVIVNFADLRPKKRKKHDNGTDESEAKAAALADKKRRAVSQTKLLLWKPERVVHALFMTKESADALSRLKIPVEVPLTSHVKWHRVPYQKSILRKLIMASHPCSICCDKRALFGSLSAEILKACLCFNITPKQLRSLVLEGFRRAFVSEDTRAAMIEDADAEISRLFAG